LHLQTPCLSARNAAGLTAAGARHGLRSRRR
jgi:hypothetical protein